MGDVSPGRDAAVESDSSFEPDQEGGESEADEDASSDDEIKSFEPTPPPRPPQAASGSTGEKGDMPRKRPHEDAVTRQWSVGVTHANHHMPHSLVQATLPPHALQNAPSHRVAANLKQSNYREKRGSN